MFAFVLKRGSNAASDAALAVKVMKFVELAPASIFRAALRSSVRKAMTFMKWSLGVLLTYFTLALAAHAGTTGTEFQDAYTMLTEWINGYFGRALSVAFLLVGLFMGIARQNLMACGVSIAVAFGLIITPTVLDNILSATISTETVSIEAPAAVATPTIATKGAVIGSIIAAKGAIAGSVIAAKRVVSGSVIKAPALALAH